MKINILLSLLVMLLSLPLYSPAQVVGEMGDESKLYAETKQVNQFFRRFNGEEDKEGERYYPKDKEYRDPQLRRKYIGILFDASNSGIKEDLKKEFIEHVTHKRNPVTLDFHGDNWFAEINAVFNYKGKNRDFTLFMKLEKERLGHKWVIYKVYSDIFRDYLKKDTSQHDKFLHPLSHELDFMNLRKALKNEATVNQFTIKDFKPDYLTLFLFEVQTGSLKFKTIKGVNFHFFQIGGWYFKLSNFNRPGYNTGWLMSNLVKVADRDKNILRKYIYYEDK